MNCDVSVSDFEARIDVNNQVIIESAVKVINGYYADFKELDQQLANENHCLLIVDGAQ